MESTYFDFNVENNDNDPKFELVELCKDIKIKKTFFQRLHSTFVRRSFSF